MWATHRSTRSVGPSLASPAGKVVPHGSRPSGFRSNVKDYYQAFDLFVCPSRREPLPRVILEALDAGVPVVASTADGCRELLEVYPGDLFPIEDVTALAALLRQHYEARTPHREVDLSAHHLDTTARVLLERYVAVIAHRRQRAPHAR